MLVENMAKLPILEAGEYSHLHTLTQTIGHAFPVLRPNRLTPVSRKIKMEIDELE